MRSSHRKPTSGGRIAVAVLLSAGLHGLIVLGVLFAPVRLPVEATKGDPTQVAEDFPPLGLDDSPPRKSTPRPPKPVDDEVKPASFDVRLVDAPPERPAPAVTVGPGPAAPAPSASAGPSGAGDSTGDGGGPCALPVGKAARSVVYVVDRSMSMGLHGALARARREVLASLNHLPPGTRFQVIAYNREAEPLSVNGFSGLLAADEKTMRQVGDMVSALRAAGGTDDGRALRRALAFHPDVLFFLTDADDVSPDDVRTATRLNERRTVIHCVELSGGSAQMDGPLHRLAADNGGTYQRLDPEE